MQRMEKVVAQKRLEQLQNVKKAITKYLVKLHTQNTNILLSVDKIMFDNTIMIDNVIKNFEELDKIFK